MDTSEDFVGLPVSASPFPPPFDNSTIVTEDAEELAGLAGCAESASEKFEANCFCPSDIPSICLPAWGETPGTPLATDNNADAKA